MRGFLIGCIGIPGSALASKEERAQVRAKALLGVFNLLLVGDPLEVLLSLIVAHLSQPLLQLVELNTHQHALKLSQVMLRLIIFDIHCLLAIFSFVGSLRVIFTCLDEKFVSPLLRQI